MALLTILLFFMCLVPITIQEIAIERIIIQQTSLTAWSFAFPNPFISTPQLAITIEQFDLGINQILIKMASLNATEASVTLGVIAETTSGSLGGTNTYIELGLLFTDEAQLQFSYCQIDASNTTPTINYKTEHSYLNVGNSYRVTIFPLIIPMRYTMDSLTSTGFGLIVNNLPTAISLTSYHFSYLLVTRQHIRSHILVLFDQITKYQPGYMIILSDEGYLFPSDRSVLLGISSIHPILTTMKLQKYVSFGAVDPTTRSDAIQIGYQGDLAQYSHLQSVFFTFSNEYENCGSDSDFLTYEVEYETLPTACLPCHSTCQTCIASFLNPSTTDANFCLGCPTGRFLQKADSASYGSCECIGTQNSDGSCSGCQSNCLSFQIQFMRSSHEPTFILIFTKQLLQFQIPISSNLKLQIDSKPISPIRIAEHHNQAAYLITVDKQDLSQCELSCSIMFIFSNPRQIYSYNGQSKIYLSKQEQTLTLNNYFSVEDRLPKELTQAFSLIGLLIGAASASGQTSLIKMLFELQQIIQFHKYLNMDIPVVFKEFVESLSSFKFMDVTSFIPVYVVESMRNASDSDLDVRGPLKAVYYENGANYYKNIVEVIFSLFIILAINVILFLLLRIIPCDMLSNLGQKMKVRMPITVSDMVESIILPAILYGIFQSSYIILKAQYLLIYLLQSFITGLIIVYPIVLLVVMRNRWMRVKSGECKQILKEVLEDLFQDCKVESESAKVMYLITYFRKFFFALFLNPMIPGLVQVFLLIVVNFIQVFMIFFVVSHRLYTSRLKIVTRSINLICILGIEFLTLAYNVQALTVDKMILVGVTCTYLAIIATIAGLFQIFIKLGEVLFQRIKGSNKIRNQCESQVDNDDQRIKCYIGHPLKKINQSSDKLKPSQSDEESEEEQSSDDDFDFGVKLSDKKKKRLQLLKRKMKKKEQGEEVEDQVKSDNSQIVPMASDDTLLGTWEQFSQVPGQQPRAQKREIKKNRYDEEDLISKPSQSSFPRRRRRVIKARDQPPGDILQVSKTKSDPRQIYNRPIKKSNEEESDLSDIIQIDNQR